jgi:hypothetical protein
MSWRFITFGVMSSHVPYQGSSFWSRRKTISNLFPYLSRKKADPGWDFQYLSQPHSSHPLSLSPKDYLLQASSQPPLDQSIPPPKPCLHLNMPFSFSSQPLLFLVQLSSLRNPSLVDWEVIVVEVKKIWKGLTCDEFENVPPTLPIFLDRVHGAGLPHIWADVGCALAPCHYMPTGIDHSFIITWFSIHWTHHSYSFLWRHLKNPLLLILGFHFSHQID